MKDVDGIAREAIRKSIEAQAFRMPRADEIERATAGIKSATTGIKSADESVRLRSEWLYRRTGRVMAAVMAACIACMVSIGELNGRSLGFIVAKSLPDDFAQRFEAGVRSLSQFMYPPPGGKG